MKAKQTKYCKGCKAHHNAGHSANSPKAKIYNDWCCKYGRTAYKAMGECKLKNGRVDN